MICSKSGFDNLCKILLLKRKDKLIQDELDEIKEKLKKEGSLFLYSEELSFMIYSH